MTAIRRHLAANRAIWALYAVTAVWIGWFALRVHVYFVMPDEARYVKQAIEIWAHLRPLVPGDTDFATWSQIQPLLMAPLWGLFNTSTAYQLSHVLNALVLASAVFPAYLLGRRVLASRAWGLAAAVLTVVVPWSVMAGVMMTEVAAYPLALWAVLAIHHAITRPGPRADVLALAALALAFLGRTQLIILAPALPIGLLVQGLRYPNVTVGARTRRIRATLREHPIVFGVVVLVGLALIVRHKAVLGNAPSNGPFQPNGWFTAREMLAYVAIGVGMVPLALSAAWGVATVLRPLDPVRHAYAVLLLYVGVVMTIAIGGGSVAFTAGINDRYLCYLAPLLMIGMLACLLERRHLLAVPILAASAGCAWLAWGSKLELVGQTFVSPSAAWHKVLFGRAPEIGELFGAYDLTPQRLVAWATVVVCVAIVLARRWVSPTLLAGLAALGVGAWCLAETTYTRGKLLEIQPAAGYANGRDWVDRALPYGASVDIILSDLGDPASATAVWWDLTFWNHDVRGMRYILPRTKSWADQAFPRGFFINYRNGAVRGLTTEHHIVQGESDRRFAFRGQTPVAPPQNNLVLSAVPGPVTAAWVRVGRDETGFVAPGDETLLRVFGDGTAGAHTVTLQLGPRFADKQPSRYSITSEGRRLAAGSVRPGKTEPVAVKVVLPASGHADLTLLAPEGGRSPGVQFYGASIALTAPQ